MTKSTCGDRIGLCISPEQLCFSFSWARAPKEQPEISQTLSVWFGHAWFFVLKGQRRTRWSLCSMVPSGRIFPSLAPQTLRVWLISGVALRLKCRMLLSFLTTSGLDALCNLIRIIMRPFKCPCGTSLISTSSSPSSTNQNLHGFFWRDPRDKSGRQDDTSPGISRRRA